MSLNKSVCKRCCNTHPTGQGLIRWNSEDTTDWKAGRIRCPIAKPGQSPATVSAADVNGPPPEHCPYAAEHVVSQ